MIILGFSFFTFFGVIFMELFPAIRVDETGLYIKKVFTEDHFAWDEVKEVTNARRFKNAKAIVFAPKGNMIKNFVRYYPYFIHGLLAGVSLEPVVFLSEGLQQRDEILKEIGRHILNKVYSQTSLPLKQ